MGLVGCWCFHDTGSSIPKVVVVVVMEEEEESGVVVLVGKTSMLCMLFTVDGCVFEILAEDREMSQVKCVKYPDAQDLQDKQIN